MGLLDSKVALVTGAGRGIGKEISLTFAKEGADVVCLDLDPESASSTAREVEELGRRSMSLKCDVSNLSEVEGAFKSALDKFGRIDILVNNAGITRDNLLLKMSQEEWDLVLKVNLKGAFNCCKAIIKHMMKQRSGKIINIASIIGLIGNVGQTNYAASKGGLIAFTKALAKELATRNINVNAIAPGFIRTAMTEALPEEIREQMLKNIPLGRFGEPSDVANVALFLASPLSDYITGQVLVVDGGMVM